MSEEEKKRLLESWMKHMRSGEFEKAWKISEAEFISRNYKPTNHLPIHLQNIWNGSSLENKIVLIRCYHGLGDTIQFIRYASLVKEIAREVIVLAQPELTPLLESVPGIDQLLPLSNSEPEVFYDVDVEVMELPFIFKTSLETIPLSIPYITVENSPVQTKNKPLATGIVWRAGIWDQRRNIPFNIIKQIAEIPGTECHILQGNAIESGWDQQTGIYNGEKPLKEYAELVNSLDLLITVDSMPAHLAGAMGIPVWTILRKHADWRWLENTSDSPWYPTMKLFRQSVEGDWTKPISEVKNELKELLVLTN